MPIDDEDDDDDDDDDDPDGFGFGVCVPIELGAFRNGVRTAADGAYAVGDVGGEFGSLFVV